VTSVSLRQFFSFPEINSFNGVVMLEGEDLGEHFLTKFRKFEKGQVKSTRNRRACMRNLMTVEKAKDVCKALSKWTEVVSAFTKGKRA
jgi:siroheme synthase (precorrin-2 oxidase/ferrochelatase)